MAESELAKIMSHLPLVDLAAFVPEERPHLGPGRYLRTAQWKADASARRRRWWKKRKRELKRAKGDTIRRTALLLRPRRRKSLLSDEMRILAAMDPGVWYGRADLRDVSRLPYDRIKSCVGKLKRRGHLDEAQNPDWQPIVSGERLWQMSGSSRYLFRLSGEGERLRELAHLLF